MKDRPQAVYAAWGLSPALEYARADCIFHCRLIYETYCHIYITTNAVCV